MEKTEFKQIIDSIVERKYETTNIELKSAKEGNPKKIYDTLSSMSNTSGGLIIFGIDEKDNYNVCGVKDVTRLYKDVQELCKDMEPPIRPEFIDFEYKPGVFVVGLIVKEIPYEQKPAYYKKLGLEKGSYIRVGESDEHLTDYEIFQFQSAKNPSSAELDTFPNLNLEESINKLALDSYVLKASQEKPNFANLSKELMYKMLGLYKDGNPTLCCALCFGIYPQYISPTLTINCTRVSGNEYINPTDPKTRFISSQTITGTIDQMFNQAINFVRNNTKHAIKFDENANRIEGDEYPIIAIRELILNALIHRDYSAIVRTIPISITIYDNRIEIENPGSLLGGYKIDNLGKEYLPIRNPFIASTCETVMQTENRHSGIIAARQAMQNNNLLLPLFETKHGYFKVTLFNDTFAPNKLELINELISYCKTPRTKQSIALKFGYSEDRASYFYENYVKPLVQKEILHLTIPEKPTSKNQRITSFSID